MSLPSSNGGNGGIVGAAVRVSDKIIQTMPPAFLLLILINVAFLGMVMWFINHQADQREAMVSSLLDRCMSIALEHEPPPQGK